MNDTAQMVLRLGYRGADFAGFAAQPGQRTVAGELTSALQTFLRREVEIVCAGRTDAGVHATAQYVSLPVSDAELELGAHRLLVGLNAILADDISVIEVFRAAPDFSARFDAVTRHYSYRIFCGSSRPVMNWGRCWWVREALDVEAMQEAAAHLLGEHDFKSFCKAASAEGKTTMRCINSLEVCRIEEAGECLIALDICGNAFLHSMVRTIAGTLAEVGAGKRNSSWVKEVLEARDRQAAGQCAPAEGLVLCGVDYEDGALTPWPDDRGGSC